MGPAEWIAAVAVCGGFTGWMSAIWIRAGRILQRIDDLTEAHCETRESIGEMQIKIARLEARTE